LRSKNLLLSWIFFFLFTFTYSLLFLFISILIVLLLLHEHLLLVNLLNFLLLFTIFVFIVLLDSHHLLMQLSVLVFDLTHILVDILFTALNIDFSVNKLLLLDLFFVNLDILLALDNHGIFLLILFQVLIAFVLDHDLAGVDALM